MKTEKINLHLLRNDEHFQFQTEFKDLITSATPAALKIAPQFDAYLLLYTQEDESLKKIMKSAFTEEIESADRQRDLTFRGMVDANRAALNHFRADVKTAARYLQVVFDTYGNLARKPLNEETSAIYNLLQELNGTYAEEVTATGIADWAKELEANNKAFEALMKNRYDESAQRTDLVLKEVRTQIDTACRTITERIDALALIEGGEVYDGFIRRLNVVVEKYNNVIASRAGRSRKSEP
jgi:hypothetical protein